MSTEIVTQFLRDVYSGCDGDFVFVTSLKPMRCRIYPVKDLNRAIKEIDFEKELFFSVGTYKAGSVKSNGSGRTKANLASIGIMHFDFDKKTFSNALEYFRSKDLPDPSYIFQRLDRFHVYYMLDKPCTDFDLYEKILKADVKILKSDPLPAQPAALMRVPYAAHLKTGKAQAGYSLVK